MSFEYPSHQVLGSDEGISLDLLKAFQSQLRLPALFQFGQVLNAAHATQDRMLENNGRYRDASIFWFPVLEEQEKYQNAL